MLSLEASLRVIVRRLNDCGQKVKRMKIIPRSDARFSNEADDLYIKTCSFKVVLELEDDRSKGTNRSDLDNGFTCVQNAFWGACCSNHGIATGTDARVRTIFGDPTSFGIFRDSNIRQ
jgi:hypothetical protein